MAELFALLPTKKTNESKKNTGEKDTWVIELPAEVCRREGFAEGTMISLTVKNAGIRTSIIHPSTEIDDFVTRVINEEKEYFEEMKRLGD
jgi:hypothetical protein